MNTINFLETELKIYPNDVIKCYEYIDIIEFDDDYRIHNIASGIILKVNKIVALLVILIKKEVTYKELLESLNGYLGDMCINEDQIRGILSYLLDIKFINIDRKRYETKILLINPCYVYENEVYRKLSIVPPLGILNIATVLFNEGYNVKIIDMLLEDIRPQYIDTYIYEYQPDIVGISMNFTSTANVCISIAENIKKCGDYPIFIGGNHATFMYEELIKNKSIDYVIRYQGEYTVLELVDIIRTKQYKKLESCKGIVFRISNEIVLTNEREIISDMDSLPIPAWHLLKIYKYKPEDRWSLNTSYGCPCSCAFCSTSSFNKGDKLYYMSPDAILKRIRKIVEIEGTPNFSISFSDDAFTCNRKRIEELCNKIIEENFEFVWACSTRIDLVNKNLLELMYKAGCRGILFGIESCDNNVLKKIGKKIDIEKAYKAVELAKSVGLSVKEMFILGLPFENQHSINLIEEFFENSKPNEIRFGMLSVYPGTPIWNDRDKYGINVLTNDWSKYDLLRPTSNNTIFSEESIYKWYIELTEKYENIKMNVGKS